MSKGDRLVFQKQQEIKPIITMGPPPDEGITFSCHEHDMLRITKNGFFVRGVRATADDQEAEQVYNCFKEWLSWHTLNR